MSDVPRGWLAVCIRDLAGLRSGFGFPISLQGRIAGDLGFYKVGDISKNWQQRKIYLSTAEHYISNVEALELRATAFPAGTIVFAKIGAAVALNRRAILKDESLVDNNVMGLVPFDCVTPAFLFHFMCQVDLGAKTRGGNVPSLRKGDVEEIPIPLPPLAEQKRIVAKIEELFSEVEAGEESLRTARRQLGVYRQSLLKQAFEGKLTADWRAERRAEGAGGKEGGSAGSGGLDGSGDLADIPDGWQWIKLGSLGELGRGKSKHRPRNDPILYGGPYPFIQTAEVKSAIKTVNSFSQTYSEAGLAQSRLWPRGTLCITIAANIAETAFLGFDACFPDSVVGFVPDLNLVHAEFVEFFFRSAKDRIEQYAPATAQKNINLTTLEDLVIPLCPLPEQQEIVRLLDEQFEVIERNEREIDAALKRSEALRQAILKKAFTGRLVPQDPADEPASQLLARLRAGGERALTTVRSTKRLSTSTP